MIILKGIAGETVEQRLGQIVEIHPGRIAGIFHNDVDVIIAIARAQALKVLAKEFAEQLLVIPGLRGQAVTTDFERAVFSDPAADLAILDPAIHA